MTDSISRSEHNDQSLIAAIDLGSNSFHMIVARQEGDEIRPIERLGEKVQLAAGLDDHGVLSSDAMDRGLACLSRFAQYVRGLPAHRIRVVGTNALRMATNAEEFLSAAEKVLGHAVDVIAGREEARLIFQGVAHTMAGQDEARLVIDVGGGSTEFAIGKGFNTTLLESLHMGCVVYTKRFFPQGVISAQNFQAAYYAARLELLNIIEGCQQSGWSVAIGSSGTVKSIAFVLQGLGMTRSGITLEGLEHLRRQVIAVGSVDKLNLSGLKPDRVGIFPAGLAILMAVFEAFQIPKMAYSDGALREGLLYDMLGRFHHVDVRNRTVQALMRRYHVDTKHAKRVSKHALKCFDQVDKVWLLEQEDRQLLEWAAQLHEIGLDISHAQFHKHGAYILKHADLLGFSQDDQLRLAMLVRCHRRALPEDAFVDFVPGIATRMFKLAILLRIAILLNHVRDDELLPEYRLDATTSGTALSLSLRAGWLSEHPLTQADFEQEQAYLAKTGFSFSVQ
ncbi:Ppx/GppA phosphatase family protein [Zooshikella harenae]|uniref:HD domain-containing protein n=1 Tax=Zooshikella harenae TaxID=2827238 RepID=A0ABS5ZDC0_9GAMM|nr:HD domain-containing protein [Zooshikella harenae]MBU2711853.1 HD domain-containing protein [Zooshikella harenae]